MTVTLPSGWGPVTVLAVLYALAAAAGGVVSLVQGDIDYQQFVDSLKYPAALVGLTGIGRGIAYGGPGTGFDKEEEAE